MAVEVVATKTIDQLMRIAHQALTEATEQKLDALIKDLQAGRSASGDAVGTLICDLTHEVWNSDPFTPLGRAHAYQDRKSAFILLLDHLQGDRAGLQTVKALVGTAIIDATANPRGEESKGLYAEEFLEIGLFADDIMREALAEVTSLTGESMRPTDRAETAD